MKFSTSMIKEFGTCALRGKFRYIDGLPDQTGSSAVFGSAVHAGLEAFHLGADLAEAQRVFLDYLDNNEPDYWNRRTTYTGFKSKGLQMIEDYVSARRWSESTILAAEMRFMVDMGEHQLSGIVDYLEVPDDMSYLKIGDLKSGKKPNMDNLHLDLQFSVYDWASRQPEFWMGYKGQEDKYPGLPNGEELYEIFKDVPRKLVWYDLRGNREIDVGERTERDYGRLYRCCEQIARAVEYEVFIPTVNGDNCTWCSYQDVCPVSWKNESESDIVTEQ